MTFTNTVTLSAIQLRHVMDVVDVFNKVISESHEIVVDLSSDGTCVFAKLYAYMHDDNNKIWLGTLDLLECCTDSDVFASASTKMLFHYAAMHN